MMIKKFFDVIVPRFLTEYVALQEMEDGYVIVCALHDVEEDENFDAIMKMQTFNFFGLGLFHKSIGDIIPWSERHGCK